MAGDPEKRRGVRLAPHSFAPDPPGNSTIGAREALGQNETRVPRHPGRTIAIDRHGEEGEREKKEAEGTRRPSREIIELGEGGRDTVSKKKSP